MNSLTTTRFVLPLLAAGQADKELTHNEALTRIDMLLHPVVQAVGLSVPPTTPGVGQCWVVGANPTGAWAGQANRLAGWSEGGMALRRPAGGSRRVGCFASDTNRLSGWAVARK